jgi:hypothetical protein
MLALPWSKMSADRLLPSFLINAPLLYLLGTLFQPLRRRSVSR